MRPTESPGSVSAAKDPKVVLRRYQLSDVFFGVSNGPEDSVEDRYETNFR